MPELSRFSGMVIRMWYNDHGDPHIHVFYNGKLTKIDLSGNVITRLYLPPNKLSLVRDWIKKHYNELENCWQLIRDRNTPGRIKPWK